MATGSAAFKNGDVLDLKEVERALRVLARAIKVGAVDGKDVEFNPSKLEHMANSLATCEVEKV